MLVTAITETGERVSFWLGSFTPPATWTILDDEEEYED